TPSLTRASPEIWHDAAYREKLSNTYDNTILYTDYFLAEVIAAVKASGRPLAAILYVPDHGEDLYDGGCEKWGHGKATTAGPRIPMLFWYSDAYEQAFQKKLAALRVHRDEPLTTESVFPLLLDAAEIHYPGEKSTQSVMSEAFARQPRRIVFGLSTGA